MSAWLPAHTPHGQQALRLLTRPLSPLRLPRQPRSQISGGRLRPRGWSQVSKHTDVRDAAPRGQVGPGAKPPPSRLPSPKSRRPERTRACRARSEEPRAPGPVWGRTLMVWAASPPPRPACPLSTTVPARIVVGWNSVKSEYPQLFSWKSRGLQEGCKGSPRPEGTGTDLAILRYHQKPW